MSIEKKNFMLRKISTWNICRKILYLYIRKYGDLENRKWKNIWKIGTIGNF